MTGDERAEAETRLRERLGALRRGGPGAESVAAGPPVRLERGERVVLVRAGRRVPGVVKTPERDGRVYVLLHNGCAANFPVSEVERDPRG